MNINNFINIKTIKSSIHKELDNNDAWRLASLSFIVVEDHHPHQLNLDQYQDQSYVHDWFLEEHSPTHQYSRHGNIQARGHCNPKHVYSTLETLNYC